VGKELITNDIYSDTHLVYADSVLQAQQYMFGVTSLFNAHGRENVVDEERPGCPGV